MNLLQLSQAKIPSCACADQVLQSQLPRWWPDHSLLNPATAFCQDTCSLLTKRVRSTFCLKSVEKEVFDRDGAMAQEESKGELPDQAAGAEVERAALKNRCHLSHSAHF